MDEPQLKKRLAEDIALSLGLERPPAMLTERELEDAKIRTCSSLQADRAAGAGIQWVKLKGSVRYPLSCVLDFIVSSRMNHTGDMSSSVNTQKRCRSQKQIAVTQNLKKCG